MTGEEAGEKSHDPTHKRLADARRQGELPRSTDVTGAAALAGLILALAASGAGMAEQAGAVFAGWLAAAAAGEAGGTAAWGLLAASGRALAALMLLPLAAAALAVAGQRALVFTPSKLQPKLSRLSPIEQAKQKFGWSGLFEFAKSSAKLAIATGVAAAWLWAGRDRLLASLQAAPGQVAALMGDMLLGFLLSILAVSVAVAAVDYLWQAHDHRRRHRMTHRELRDEHKETEGDPYLKQARRSRGQEIARNRMLAEVPRADVVVVNPQHYAVALRWERASGRVPVCVAKGVDEIAARIREIAAEAGVPLHRDPPTARALHATVEIGAEIRPEHYRAVAAAIRFAERMRAAARARGFR